MVVQRWKKRAWFQRIRGGGCQTLVYGGKTHVFPPCFVFPYSLVLFPTTSINNCCCYLGAVIVLGVGVAGLLVLAYMHTPLLHDSPFFHSGLLILTHTGVLSWSHLPTTVLRSSFIFGFQWINKQMDISMYLHKLIGCVFCWFLSMSWKSAYQIMASNY